MTTNPLTAEDKKLLRPLMWDVDIESIDSTRNSRFVIERLLRFGLPQHVRWVLAHYPPEEIIRVVKCSRVIDRRTACFWALHFGIAREEITCLNRQLTNPCFY